MAGNHLVLYRKYRPTKLEDVVGQEQITRVLSNSLKQGKVAHAYLFIGPRGTGKTSVARIFAHAINGFDYQVEDNYLDIIEIDAASNTGVDNIRELREKAIIAPTKGKYKVYIIDEVHMLTKSASNALLKTLEEPPEHVIFIMATTDAHKVPITISSRTQVYTFRLADPEIMTTHLRKIADQEGIKIDDAALKILVRRGGGSFRDSLSLLDQIASLSDQEITATMLTQALGLPQEQTITELLTAYVHQDQTRIHDLLQDLLNTGIKPEVLVSEMVTIIMRNPEPQLLPLLAKLPDVKPPFPEAKLLLAFLRQDRTNLISDQNINKIASAATNQSATAPTIAKAEMTQPATVPAEKTEVVTKPTTAVTAEKPTPSGFDWENFLETVHQANDAVYLQLRKCDYDCRDETLHLYPDKNFAKIILSKPGNRQLLLQYLGGRTLTIHEPGEGKTPQDDQIQQISAIMGGVKEVKGDTPF